ncbi:cdc45, partial [Symbiodinium microadriaticum]
KRKALAEKYDPLKARRRSLEQYYSQGTSYTVPTAVMLVNLVKKLNRSCTNDILWQAILGATDQYHRCRISEGLYEAICNEIKRELPDDSSRGKYTVGEGVEEVAVPGAEAGHIQPGSEYRFYMCRHWSLFEAMSYSNYISSKLMVWKVQGALKLQ